MTKIFIMSFQRALFYIRTASVAFAIATVCATASAYNLNNTYMFACEIRPVSNPSMYLYISDTGVRSRYAYAVTYLSTVEPYLYILVDPVVQYCAAQWNVGNGAVMSTARCNPDDIDIKPVFDLRYAGQIAGRPTFKFYNLNSRKMMDTWGYSNDNTAVWQHADSGSNNQKFFLDKCRNEWGDLVSPASR